MVEIKENSNKENTVHKLNFLPLSSREDKNKVISPSNSNTPSNKEYNKLDILFHGRENSILSLQKYLNYSKQKRIKYEGENKNTFYQKGEESRNKINKKELNLSGLEPSISLNNNFKKVVKRNEETKKMRSSSVCYSSNNNHENSNQKKRMNKTNCLNDGGKTIDLNKINSLYNLMNMTHKGSLSSKNNEKRNKINFREKFSSLVRPIGSPRNINKANLLLKKEYGKNTNRLIPFCLPNLLKGTISPSFMNGFKLKGTLNLNLGNVNQVKIKLSKKNNKIIDINYKKLINDNKSNPRRPVNFKRSSSTNMFSQFMKNNPNKNGIYQRKNNNFEKKSHLGDSGRKYYSNLSTKKKNNNSSDINI